MGGGQAGIEVVVTAWLSAPCNLVWALRILIRKSAFTYLPSCGDYDRT